MSRVGRKPIQVPAKVKVTINPTHVAVEGPLGQLRTNILRGAQVVLADGELQVTAPKASRGNGGFQGTMRAVLANMVEGVMTGYQGTIDINGVGYKAEMKGKDVVRFSLGYTEPRDVPVPAGCSVVIDKNQTSLTAKGPDRQVVFQLLATMRALKLCDPYKAKGVKYRDEVVRRKAGKAGAK